MLLWIYAIGVWLVLALLLAVARVVVGGDGRGGKKPPKSMGQKLQEAEFLTRIRGHW